MNKGLWIAAGMGLGIAVCVLVSAAPQGTDSNNGPMVMGTGGSKDNRNDLCWMLFRDGKATGTKGEKKVEVDRYVLTCYKVPEGGRGVEVVGIRDVSWDLKAVDMRANGKDSPSPAEMFEAYAKTIK